MNIMNVNHRNSHGNKIRESLHIKTDRPMQVRRRKAKFRKL